MLSFEGLSFSFSLFVFSKRAWLINPPPRNSHWFEYPSSVFFLCSRVHITRATLDELSRHDSDFEVEEGHGGDRDETLKEVETFLIIPPSQESSANFDFYQPRSGMV